MPNKKAQVYRSDDKIRTLELDLTILHHTKSLNFADLYAVLIWLEILSQTEQK